MKKNNCLFIYFLSHFLFLGGGFARICELSNTDTYMDKVIHIKLQANALRLVGATYANYTKPLNYFDETIGTVTNPYLIRRGSITKFLPIIVRKNDPNQIELIDEITLPEKSGVVWLASVWLDKLKSLLP